MVPFVRFILEEDPLFGAHPDHERRVSDQKDGEVPWTGVGQKEGAVAQEVSEVDGMPDQTVESGRHDASVGWQQTEAAPE